MGIYRLYFQKVFMIFLSLPRRNGLQYKESYQDNKCSHVCMRENSVFIFNAALCGRHDISIYKVLATVTHERKYSTLKNADSLTLKSEF